jgi:DNA-binding response OmpR family regulator
MEVPVEKIKIVTADDDEDISRLLKKLLEAEGYDVTAVNDGKAAVEAFRRVRPALVILDVTMPVMDGMGACEAIRQEDDQVLILMLTGHKTEESKVKGLGLGADGYLTKPFGEKELTARIRSLFRRALP